METIGPARGSLCPSVRRPALLLGPDSRRRVFSHRPNTGASSTEGTWGLGAGGALSAPVSPQPSGPPRLPRGTPAALTAELVRPSAVELRASVYLHRDCRVSTPEAGRGEARSRRALPGACVCACCKDRRRRHSEAKPRPASVTKPPIPPVRDGGRSCVPETSHTALPATVTRCAYPKAAVTFSNLPHLS